MARIKMPLVLCTTGLSPEQIEKVKETSRQTAILRSANMSLGINTLMKLVQDAAKVLANAGFDIEIVEKHHNKKLDAPSGTALALADSINEAMDRTLSLQIRPQHGACDDVMKMKSAFPPCAAAPLWVTTM